jgi:hypothetical protein
MPFALARDFARRYDFAHLATGRAVVLDLTAAVVQLCVLAWLGMSGRMSATGACAAIGAGCALPTAIWLYHSRGVFKFNGWHVQATLRQTWALGKWLLAGRITGQVQQYVSYWLAAVIGGTAITGVYAACMSIVGFANPLIIGLTNVCMPKLILAWKHGGNSVRTTCGQHACRRVDRRTGRLPRSSAQSFSCCARNSSARGLRVSADVFSSAQRQRDSLNCCGKDPLDDGY